MLWLHFKCIYLLKVNFVTVYEYIAYRFVIEVTQNLISLVLFSVKSKPVQISAFYHLPLHLDVSEWEKALCVNSSKGLRVVLFMQQLQNSCPIPIKMHSKKKEQKIYCANSSPSPLTHTHTHLCMVAHGQEKQLSTLLDCTSRTAYRLKEYSMCFQNDNAVIRCTSKSAEMIPMICGTVSRVAKLDCTVQEEICVGVGPFVSGWGA